MLNFIIALTSVRFSSASSSSSSFSLPMSFLSLSLAALEQSPRRLRHGCWTIDKRRKRLKWRGNRAIKENMPRFSEARNFLGSTKWFASVWIEQNYFPSGLYNSILSHITHMSSNQKRTCFARSLFLPVCVNVFRPNCNKDKRRRV